MFGLASKTLMNEVSEKYMTVGQGIANTCHEAHNRSATKLPPESFRFVDALEARASKSADKYYILRPETVESYFMLWRLTGDPKYRKWGWEVVEVSSVYSHLSRRKIRVNPLAPRYRCHVCVDRGIEYICETK